MGRNRRIFISLLTLTLTTVITSPNFAQATTPESIVIGVDTSGSMEGAALEEAIDAAETLVSRLGQRRQLEVYTFARTITRVGPSTLFSTVESRGYTALYDSILELGQRSDQLDAPLIIITDGQDSRSLISPADLISRLAALDVSINIIAYQPRAEDEEVLRSIALSNSGGVFDVGDADQLVGTLEAVVSEVHRDSISDSSFDSNSTSDPLVILIASATGLLSFSLLTLMRRWRKKEHLLNSWSEVLDEYHLENIEDLRSVTLLDRLISPIGRFIGDTSQILPRVRGGGPRELLLTALFVAIFSALMVIGINAPLSIFLVSAILVLTLKFLVQNAENRAREEFERELPGAMKLLASSLTAGLSFLQALNTFSAESKTQVAREFRRALSEIQMGAPVEQAFGDVAERMRSEDLRWVVFAFSVQREVGGSLAKILQTSAETIESRANLRQEVKTLSAEGRISSYILMLLPLAIFTFLLITRPSFVSLFWEETIGQMMVAVIVVLMSLSWVWIRRLTRIEA